MGRDSVLNRALQGSWEHLRQRQREQGAREAAVAAMGSLACQVLHVGTLLGLVRHLTMAGKSSRVVGAALAVQRIGGVRCQTGVSIR